jgi:hypothetical protein
MSGNTNLAEAISVLKSAESGVGAGRGLGQPGQPDAKMLAFQAQMRMAQQAIGAGSLTGEESGGEAFGLDMSMTSDSMMMDALTTIARLTGQGISAQKPVLAEAPERVLTRNPSAQGSGAIGSLAALFESGEKGVAAIGFDRTGGTSYGKFQISSRAGTMNRFLSFLNEREPALAERLRRSGPANTGSTRGGMPVEWVKIAQEMPERFEALQTEFIKKDHYQPAREKIFARTGVDIETAKPALREALFSTAVQHGASGAARIFNQAIDKFLGKEGAQASATVPGVKNFEQALVSEVYNKRQNQFGGSTEAVRASVRGRLRQEKDMVLAMLDKQGMNRVV